MERRLAGLKRRRDLPVAHSAAARDASAAAQQPSAVADSAPSAAPAADKEKAIKSLLPALDDGSSGDGDGDGDMDDVDDLLQVLEDTRKATKQARAEAERFAPVSASTDGPKTQPAPSLSLWGIPDPTAGSSSAASAGVRSAAPKAAVQSDVLFSRRGQAKAAPTAADGTPTEAPAPILNVNIAKGQFHKDFMRKFFK